MKVRISAIAHVVSSAVLGVGWVPFAQNPVLAQTPVSVAEAKAEPLSPITTATEGERVARVAVAFVGLLKVRPQVGPEDDLRTGVNNASFVSQVYKVAGVPCPDPPSENMALFGKLVDWREGPARMGNLTVTLPALASREALIQQKVGRPGLQPGDRVFFHPTPDVSEATNTPAKPNPADTGYVGIFIGRYNQMTRAFVYADPKQGKVVVADLDAAPHQELYRYAARGWTARQIYGEGREVLQPSQLAPGSVVGTDDIPSRTSGGRVLAFCVGVNRYPSLPPSGDSGIGNGAADDARRVFNALKARTGKRFSPQSLLLTDTFAQTGEGKTKVAAPTQDQILAQWEQLVATAGAEDTVVFYFAGSGKQNLLYPLEYTPTSSAERAVDLNRVINRASLYPAKRLVLLLDYAPVTVPRPVLEDWRRASSFDGAKFAVALVAAPGDSTAGESFARGRFSQALVESLQADTGAKSVNEIFERINNQVGRESIVAQTTAQRCVLYASETEMTEPLLGLGVAQDFAKQATPGKTPNAKPAPARPSGSKAITVAPSSSPARSLH